MEAPARRRRLGDVFPGTVALFDETEKPPAVSPPTSGAPVQTSDTCACSDAARLLGSLPPDCGTFMCRSLRAWDVAKTSVASKAVFLLCSRGGRLIVPHIRLRNNPAAEALASRKFLVECMESLALPAVPSLICALITRGCVIEMRKLQKLSVRGLTTGSTSARVLACWLPYLPVSYTHLRAHET